MIVRDSFTPPTPMTTGTASVAGTLVTDEQTPQPLPRTRVELTMEGQAARTAYSEANGSFVFADLPAGRYTLAATKPGYPRMTYGARRPNRPGTAINVTDGQKVAGLQVRLPKGSVITGTIRDEMGQPAPGVNVRVLQYRMQNGERALAPVVGTTDLLGATTDDRGVYRIYGLAAGDYVVAATPRPLGSGDIRQITAADVQSVQRASSPAGAGAVSPPPPAVTVAYAPVYFPGTTAAGTAGTVTVGTGEEHTGIDFGLQLVRTARIEGTVGTPPGVPSSSVDLLITTAGMSVASAPGMMMTFNRVRPDAEGKFSYPGMAPGKYTINARVGNQGLWANADVIADGENISGVRLDLAPGLTLSGSITADGAGQPPDLTQARLSLQPAGGAPIIISMTAGGGGEGRIVGLSDAKIGADGRFTMPNVTPGKYTLDARLPGGWALKSARIGGKDVLDFPLEVGPNDRINDAALTFTMQTQDVSGTLRDQSGRPAPDYTVVIFPADKSLWGAARRIKTARPGTDGKFSMRGLPAGDYRIAALVDLAPGEQSDPALLEQLVPASVAFSLAAGEQRTQNITIAGR